MCKQEKFKLQKKLKNIQEKMSNIEDRKDFDIWIIGVSEEEMNGIEDEDGEVMGHVEGVVNDQETKGKREAWVLLCSEGCKTAGILR